MARPRFDVITGIYIVLLLYLGILTLAVADGAQIVHQVEAELGTSLTCEEAYHQREINDFFYPDRSFQSNLIYLSSLFLPLLMLIVVGLLLVIGVRAFNARGQTARLHWLSLSLIVAGVVVLLALMSQIGMLNLIACALE